MIKASKSRERIERALQNKSQNLLQDTQTWNK